MNVVLKNTDEAIAACMSYLSQITANSKDVETLLDLPAGMNTGLAIYKAEEVPLGWSVIYNTSKWVEQVKKTGEIGDAPSLIGRGHLLVNRWTGSLTEYHRPGFLTQAAFIRWYINNRLPEVQRDACLSSPWKYRWDISDPVRFDPPFIVVDITVDDEQVFNINLEIDQPLFNCFRAKQPELCSYAAFPNDKETIQKFELISVKETDETRIYHFRLHLHPSLLKKNRGLNELIKIVIDPDWEASTSNLFRQYMVLLSNNIDGNTW